MPFILKSFRHSFSAMAMCLVLTSVAFGQFPRPKGNQPDQQFPRVQQQVPQIKILAERPSPKMLILLDEWERKTSGIDTLKGTFVRYKYDYVFKVEKRAVGEFSFGSPDKARMDFHPDPEIVKMIKKADGQKPRHTLPNGTTFTVEPDELKTWVCTGQNILDVDHATKQYNRMEIPKRYQGQRITDGPMPFLFGMKADSVAKQYKLAFGEGHDHDHDPPTKIHIIAYPLVPHLQREFRKAELYLNPATYHPYAVKLWDPAGSTETVYAFKGQRPFTKIELTLKRPWRVSLFGYKLMEDSKPNEGQLPVLQKQAKAPLLRRVQ